MLHRPPRRTQEEQQQQYRGKPPGADAMRAKMQSVIDTVRAKSTNYQAHKDLLNNPPEAKDAPKSGGVRPVGGAEEATARPEAD